MKKTAEFIARQNAAKTRINQLDHDRLFAEPERGEFFETVYSQANDDPAMIPWADLEAKQALTEWLGQNGQQRGKAIDVGCGLGDNAEALASAGYDTVGFDFSSDAIRWAQKRFPDSPVEYQIADLFNLPEEMIGAFDLVHECYTLQSIPPETLEKSIPAVASLVAPGGTLLVYSRVRKDGSQVSGPPWPLEEKAASSFASHGLELVETKRFEILKGERNMPHTFSVWRRVK